MLIPAGGCFCGRDFEHTHGHNELILIGTSAFDAIDRYEKEEGLKAVEIFTIELII